MPIQDEVHVSLESEAFPCDRLRVRSLEGVDALSRFFDLEIELVCLDHDGPSSASMAGARASLVIETVAGAQGDDGSEGWHGTRKLHGIIAEVDDRLLGDANVRTYRVRLVPRAFALKLVELQDMFIRMSVLDIAKRKLDAVGLG